MLTRLDLPLADIMKMDRELVRLTRGYARERLDFGRVLAALDQRSGWGGLRRRPKTGPFGGAREIHLGSVG